MNKLDYKIHGIKNATKDEKEFYENSVKLMIKVLNGKDFWVELAGKWHLMEETKGYTFKQYKEMVLSGADYFNKKSDSVVDIMVHLYTSYKNVVGYTYPSTWFTWFNRKYLKTFDYADMAGHIYHENMGHNLGFGHTNANRNSLVYQTGYLMRDHVKKIISDDIKITRKTVCYRSWRTFFVKRCYEKIEYK